MIKRTERFSLKTAFVSNFFLCEPETDRGMLL